MRRRLSQLVLVLVLATPVIATPSPAHAETQVCVGVGSMFMNAGLVFPTFGDQTQTAFVLFVDVQAVCTAGGIRADGGIGGILTRGADCTQFAGGGVANGHHHFSVFSVGALAVFTGGMEGIATITSDDPRGGPIFGCVWGSTVSLLVGAYALV